MRVHFDLKSYTNVTIRIYFCNLYSVYICKRKLYMNPFPPYLSVVESKLAGRYITNTHIEPLLSDYNHSIIGHSTSGLPIYRIRMGTGSTKVLMWSQMHGNESTTTKSLFDLLRFLNTNPELVR